MWKRNLLMALVLFSGAAVVSGGVFGVLERPAVHVEKYRAANRDSVAKIVQAVDQAFAANWAAAGINPTTPADQLLIARRISLGLAGTIPSLEEIRQLERVPADVRIAWWVDRLLADERTADHLAHRLASVYVGDEEGPFLVYRRRRFVTWLAEQIHANRPYDQLVTELIAARGLWTDHPATNFITVTELPEADQGPNEAQLAGRVARAFLGVRLDCAECHDHPFAAWKQHDFQGLAAYFGDTEQNLSGIHDSGTGYTIEDHKTGKPQTIKPSVPFLPELVSTSGTHREQLAHWVTAPGNKTFSRAIVNRAWGLMFGRPLVTPVDDIPMDGPHPAALALLAEDFSQHGFDLHRLLRAITATQVFSLESRDETAGESDGTSTEPSDHWSAFPLTRLEADQVVGSMLQAGSILTCDHRSHILFKLARADRKQKFMARFGTDEESAAADPGTVPQRLLLMNGELVSEMTEKNLTNAASQIALLAPDNADAIDVAYLVVLTRQPAEEERSHFLARFKGANRNQAVADLCWTLLNSTEFSWNH